ncbi:AraC family transcriptional regulator [Streptomyces sp. NPDC049915]|uniref:helix-turn-helix domain-containing protein n=1 Tax=Streptomyces sp. NPDC049915 TaxID=3155510 RepID=UPI00341ABCB1
MDTTTAYVGAPGEEESFAHPTGGDVCTSISVTPHLWRALADDAEAPAPRPSTSIRRSTLPTGACWPPRAAETSDTRSARNCWRSWRPPSAAPRPDLPRSLPRRPRATGRSSRQLGRQSSKPIRQRTRILARRAARRLPLPPEQGLPRALGVTVTHYRQRVRIGRALDRLEAGENSLGTLAADLGYADQAHLTRTMRRYLGRTATAVRRLLT